MTVVGRTRRLLTSAVTALAALSIGAAGAIGPAQSAQAAGPRPLFQLPVNCGETWRLSTYVGHDNYDIDMTPTSGSAWGRPILASFAGTVVASGIDGTLGGRTPQNPGGPMGTGGGYYVKVDHGNGWRTLYLHMLQSPMVRVGDTVARGQQLGKVGSTGSSSGPHLHYEQQRDGAKIESWFDGVPSGITHDDANYSVNRTSQNCGSTLPVDFSGDGKADVLARHATNSDLYLYRGNGSGGFAGSAVVGNNWSGFDAIFSAGDFNGDGDGDVLARHATNKDLYLYPGNGAGGFDASRVIGNNWSGFDLIFSPGDFDGDGNVDVIGRHATNKDLYLYPGNGSGGFEASRVIGNNWSGFDTIFSAGDFNGDGKADVLARHTASQDLYLYPGNGSGGFGASKVIGNNWSGFDRILSPGDFNGDGDADVLARHATNSDLYLYPGNGAGGFEASRVVGNNWSGFDFIF
ncbi:FG-GAP-like repeat-containing protein [Micromonospora sp. NPDC050397]|uniref:FG-GAP-like repeat-containing protein n=1 Tax=Micromonospora sp. NPDC050397 TaxID=3364279 RepID=UPI00384A56A6